MKGIPNAGQTCFFNAVVQCLTYSPNLANYFLAGCEEADVDLTLKGASSVALAMASFVRDYWTREGPLADASELYAAFTKACREFPRGKQHDAHLALVALLDKIHDGLPRFEPGPSAVSLCPAVRSKPWTESLRKGSSKKKKASCSVVSEVFRMQIETSMEAKGVASVSHDHVTCLSLPVNNHSSLSQCLAKYMEPETLPDVRVDGGATTEARLAKRFTHLPRILVLHLNRFDGVSKIDRFVDYTHELSLAPYCAPECEHHYRLFAVCLHHGSMDNGHYRACCEVQDRWFALDDDASTVLVDINDIIQRDAYILLYKRL